MQRHGQLAALFMVWFVCQTAPASHALRSVLFAVDRQHRIALQAVLCPLSVLAANGPPFCAAGQAGLIARVSFSCAFFEPTLLGLYSLRRSHFGLHAGVADAGRSLWYT